MSSAAGNFAEGAVLAGRYQVRRLLAGDGEARVYQAVDDGTARPELRLLLVRPLDAEPDLRTPGESLGLAVAGVTERFELDGHEVQALDVAGGQSLADGLPERNDVAAASVLLGLLDLLEALADTGADLGEVTPARLLLAGAEPALRFLGPVVAGGEVTPFAALTRLRGLLLADDGLFSAELREVLATWRGGGYHSLDTLREALTALVDPEHVTTVSGIVSHSGLYRRQNEDAALRLGYEQHSGDGAAGWKLLAVSDGMGGHRGGQMASRLALHTLACAVLLRQAGEAWDAGATQWTDNEAVVELLRDSVHEAHHAVGGLGEAGEERAPGCTLTAALHLDRRVFVVHVGDSRAYLLRDGRIERLTRDDTVVQQMVDGGNLPESEVRGHPASHVLTQCVGQPGPIEARVTVRLLSPGDRLLLCSDGLTEQLDDEDLAQLLIGPQEPRAIAERVVDAALEAGSRDNVTAVVEDVR
jgi:serine/threonine protein phosphatase PrpC